MSNRNVFTPFDIVAPCKYIIEQEGASYFATDRYGHTAGGTETPDLSTTFQATLGLLTAGRTSKEKIICKASGLINTAILIPNYTEIELQCLLTGTDVLAAKANYDILTIPSVAGGAAMHDIDVHGGTLFGNSLGITGLRVAANFQSYNLTFRDIRASYCGGFAGFILSGMKVYAENLLADHTRLVVAGTTGGIYVTSVQTINMTLNHCTAEDGGTAGVPGVQGIIVEDQCQDVNLIDCLAQRNYGNGFNIPGTVANPIYDVKSIGCRALFNHGRGWFTNYLYGGSISDCKAFYNDTEGFYVVNSLNLKIRATGKDNSQNPANTSAGLCLDGACERNSIVGGEYYNEGGVTQRTGIEERAPSDWNIIIGNNCRTNNIANLVIAGANTLYRTATHSDPLNLV